MDQGIAAVLGAAVGITGALGSALVGYMTARHQSRDQGRLDHGLKLRDERKAAYMAFLGQTESTLSSLAFLGDCLFEPEEGSQPAWLAIEQHIDALEEDRSELEILRTRVALAGPKGADDRAGEVCVARNIEPLRSCPRLDASTQPRFDVLFQVANVRHQNFVTTVRAVLTEPPL